MPLDKREWLGTNIDKSNNEEYCYYCLKDGEYVVDVTMDEMIDIWMKYSKEFNEYSNSSHTKKEIGALLRKRLPKLKRWRQKSETIDIYHQSINKVISYINEYLFDPLDLRTLSRIANLSEFHFHRIFRAITDENVGEYIQRLRLEFVAHKLIKTDLTLTSIVELTSYGSVFALSKAFKKHFGVSPSVYRKQPDKVHFSGFESKTEQPELIPQIVKTKGLKIIYLNISNALTSNASYRKAWNELINYVKKNRLISKDSKYLSISFDDINITPMKYCRFYIGLTINSDFEPKGKFGIMYIPDGEYAVFRNKGEYSQMNKIYKDIYLKWLPESKYQLRNAFSFEIYINTPHEVNPSELITDIYISVESPDIKPKLLN